jgi:hypothetical protein
MLLKYAAPTRFECRHCRCQLPLGDASSVAGLDPLLPVAVFSASDRSTFELDLRLRGRKSRRRRQQSFAEGQAPIRAAPGRATAPEDSILTLRTHSGD